jgi:late competence protein required for DNA uptake (superfamily II DNA/RNA helicase)
MIQLFKWYKVSDYISKDDIYYYPIKWKNDYHFTAEVIMFKSSEITTKECTIDHLEEIDNNKITNYYCNNIIHGQRDTWNTKLYFTKQLINYVFKG